MRMVPAMRACPKPKLEYHIVARDLCVLAVHLRVVIGGENEDAELVIADAVEQPHVSDVTRPKGVLLCVRLDCDRFWAIACLPLQLLGNPAR